MSAARDGGAALHGDVVVITAAIVGAEVTREQSPHVPYSAQEIAEEARRCADAGASIVHLHVRTEDGKPSQDRARFEEAVAAIRARTDIVVQVSTGGAVGMSIEERLGGLMASPEMATLNCGSINFGEEVFENSMPDMREVARRIRAAGAQPELELYELGHLDNALALERAGLIGRPFWVQLVLGVPGALGARENVLRFFASELPPGTHWGVAAVGRHQAPMLSVALELGGHVRVGLEDNIYLERGVLAQGSAPFVERVVREARQHGRTPATPAQVRAALSAT
ncbi:MAG: 3-keto-5-aminohexanoate cleavage protein [Myxococcales bacterium]